jgi:hypothetical protein
VTFDGPSPTTLQPTNPFLPQAAAAAAPRREIPADAAADWYRLWPVSWNGTCWSALETAWQADAPAVRKQFRDETGRDWPQDGIAERDEAARIAAARWVNERWSAAVHQAVATWKTTNGLRGPVVAHGPLDASLSILAAGDAANHPAPVLAPRVTDDAWTNAYGVGFMLRLTADLGNRIPLPTFDFAALPPKDIPWARVWLDEAVRNGVQGLTVLPPAGDAGRAQVEALASVLATPNVYLPPPSEIAILVSTDTIAREPGAWVALFRAYAALRAAELWPNFVSDGQIRSGAVSLARFNEIVVPAGRWVDGATKNALTSRAKLGGLVVVTDPFAFGDGAPEILGWKSAAPRAEGAPAPETGPVLIEPATRTRVLATFHDGSAAITKRKVGDGAVIGAALPLASPDGSWSSFWRDIARRAAVPRRPWLAAVTMENVGDVTGDYHRPAK